MVTPPGIAGLGFRPETGTDIAAIRALNIAAFGRKGHPTDEADLVDELRDNGRVVLSLVAELGGEVVGHVLFTAVSFEPEAAPRAVALAPACVRPDPQRQGIGSALIRAGLERCREMGFGAAFVLGSQEFYGPFGFRGPHPGPLIRSSPELNAPLWSARGH